MMKNIVKTWGRMSTLSKCGVVAAVLMMICALLYKFFPAFVLLAFLLIVFLVEDRQMREWVRQVKKSALIEALPDIMVQTLRSAAVQLSALPPNAAYEVEHTPYCVPLGSTEVYHFDVYKRATAPVDSACLRDDAAILQDRLDKLVSSGTLINPNAYYLGGPLGYRVIDVQDMGIALLARVAPVFDRVSADDVARYIQKSPPPTGNHPTLEQLPAVPLAYDNTVYQSGVQRAAWWKYQQAAHMIVVGSTGSGKTYFVKQLIGNTLKYVPKSTVTACDFKADDFRFLNGCPGYYAYTDCAQGLEDFYKAFEARQMGADTSRDFRLLVFDEWAAYLSTLDKKAADAEIKRLSTLLMLGRSFECHVVISQQRADAQYFSTARDNFNVVIALGNLSNESKDMFFKGFKEEMTAGQERGTGYMLTNGTDLTAIRTQTVDVGKLERYILRHMSKTNPPADAGEA